MRPIVYLSVEGVLGHLGFSQVFRVVEGLAQRGLPYGLVTLERARDLQNRARLEAVRQRLTRAGIEWAYEAYREGGTPRLVVGNEANLLRLALRLLRRMRAGAIHARAYHAGVVSLGVAPLVRGRWVFDARGYWIDERVEEGRWFTTPVRLAAARAVERQLFSRSARVVTLTRLQADDVESGAYGRLRAPVEVIPTCADYEEFTPRAPESLTVVPAEVKARLAGRRVLGVVGSLNRAYVGDATARLARRVLDRDPDARLLVLSAQTAEWRAVFEREGLPQGVVEYASAPHEAMPQWMNLMHWALLLLTPETKAKRAMMPTKLAEFFASGVRVCVHGCNSEVEAWVERAGQGVRLPHLGEAALDEAAASIVAAPLSPALAARAATEAHFSLSRGLDRYEAMMRAI